MGLLAPGPLLAWVALPPAHEVALFALFLGAWLLALGVPLAALARGWRAGAWAAALAALFAGALGLRLAFASWGPDNDDIRYYSLFNDNFTSLDWHLGTAPIAFMRFVTLVLPKLDTTVVAFSLVWGSLAVPLLALALAQLGLRRPYALAAGALLALNPIAVHFAGGMTRVSPVLFLTTLSLWLLGRYQQKGGAWNLAAFVAAGWLTAQTRPEAGLLVVPAGLAVLLLFVPTWRELWRSPAREALAAVVLVAVVGGAHLLLSARFEPAIGGHLGTVASWRLPFLPSETPLLSLSYTPAVALALALAGAVSAFAPKGRFAVWALASLLVVMALGPAGNPRDVWAARYHGIPVLLFCVLATLGAQDVLERVAARARPWLAAGLAALVVATSAAPLRHVCEPRTIDLEYHFVRSALVGMPRCAIIYQPFDPARDFEGGFRHGDLLSVILERGRWRVWPPAEGKPAGQSDGKHARVEDGADCPSYFYRSPACSLDRRYLEREYASAYILDHCREALESAGPPLVSTELPAAPMGGEVFAAERVTVGFYPLGEAGPGFPVTKLR